MKKLPLVYHGPRPRLLWVIANNEKTGRIPSAYVGHTKGEAHATCQGCALYGTACYAWAGRVAISFGNLVLRAKAHPERYTFDYVMTARHKETQAIRLGALGDPGRADPAEVESVVTLARARGLSVLAYTHFWRERDTQHMRTIAMASCEDERGADDALAAGWRPAMLLPWTHEGTTFDLPSGAKGVVCPAQTKDAVTCNTCRMCTPEHSVWKAGKVQAIGFLDHSRAARREAHRASKGQLPIFASAPDLRPQSLQVLPSFPPIEVHYRAAPPLLRPALHPSIVVEPTAPKVEKPRREVTRSWWQDDERSEGAVCDRPKCTGGCPECKKIEAGLGALKATHEADHGPRGSGCRAVASRRRHVRGSGARGRS